ncbi:integrase catalytic domain-containing protein [Trichonephila clavipes]|uniref:Integrase catalytic domain-containing protein n=1 Tax=Trichonephila clavipes TaxID=2585209 RepID=A0A8X6VCL2_TRICX|nr:integrase catalytic domain-containing protein [Trichonephila clavipes]
MCTKAVHLELVSSLSAAAFLSALRRFVSRRSYPSDIYSDNCTNFVGASAYLKDLFQLLHNSNAQDYSSSKNIQWHFIPPYAPNFGVVVSSDEVEKDVLVSLAALLPEHLGIPNQMDAGSERPNGRIPRPHQESSLFQHQVDSLTDCGHTSWS